MGKDLSWMEFVGEGRGDEPSGLAGFFETARLSSSKAMKGLVLAIARLHSYRKGSDRMGRG